MNVIIAIVLIIVFAVLGFFLGCFACLAKIEDMRKANDILSNWLNTARAQNEDLIKENTQLLTDIELISNGKSIIRDEG